MGDCLGFFLQLEINNYHRFIELNEGMGDYSSMDNEAVSRRFRSKCNLNEVTNVEVHKA